MKNNSLPPNNGLNKFDPTSKPMYPIHNLTKIQISSLAISLEGKSNGVMMIESSLGSFVLKPTVSAPSDFFYNQLALTLDLNVPVMTIINCYDQQFKKVVFQIQKYALKDQILSHRLNNKLDFPFYEVMQYIPNTPLTSFGQKKLQNYLNKQERLYMIGMGLGFDMIINNNDRFEFIWNGLGNYDNILIQIDIAHKQIGKNWNSRALQKENQSVPLDNFVYIDHDGNMANAHDSNAGPNVQKYLQKITNFHLQMIMYLRKQYTNLPKQFQKLNNQIRSLTKYILQDDEKIKICYGIIYITKKFINAFENKQIQSLYQSMIRQTKEDKNRSQVDYWNDFWNKQFKRRVHLSYCELFYIKISAIYTTYPQLIDQIYDRVSKTIQKWKNTRKNRKRISVLNLSGHQPQQNLQNQPQQQQSQSIKDPQQNQQIQNIQQAKKKRWRQKLTAFQQGNYRK